MDQRGSDSHRWWRAHLRRDRVTSYVHGFGHYHPENEISNDFLEGLDIGTNDEWIIERVGIRSRRTVLPLDYIRETHNRDVRESFEVADISNHGMGAAAARMAIERAGLLPEQIGMVFSGSSCPDHVTPAEAALVARELGIEVPVFDVNSACTSFMAQIYLVASMRPETLPDYILLVASESLTKTVDYTDRASAVLFGDGAAAAVVSPRIPGRAVLLGAAMDSNPGQAEKVVIPRAGYFAQDGRAVQMFAIKKTRAGVDRLRAEFPDEGRSFHFAGHQANMRVLEQVIHRCGIPEELHHHNVELRGNTGSASCPSAVSMSWEKFGPRDDVAMVAVGGGLSWGHALLRFGSTGAAS
ncbi:MAG: ketoacyl-ACP synthase III [bacterium]|nr:ketoacyl-ACP synthase III [bacterium]MCP5069991.1 ketoacyl-ACP synthase III [bacterium]